MATIYISIGSNINPEVNFRTCSVALKQHFEQLIWSPIYRSVPVGMRGADFLNAVVSARTSLPVSAVVKLLKQMELNQGRESDMHGFNSRTLDIDLLLYDQLIVDTEELTLPHKELSNTAFVLVPMVDLQPTSKHPTTDQTYQDMLASCLYRQADFAAGLSKVTLEF